MTSYYSNELNENLTNNQPNERLEGGHSIQTLTLKAEENLKRIKMTKLFYLLLLCAGFVISALASVFLTIIGASNNNFPWGGPLGYEVYYAYGQVFLFSYGLFALASDNVEKISHMICLTIWDLIGAVVICIAFAIIILGQRFDYQNQLYTTMGSHAAIGLACFIVILCLTLVMTENHRGLMRKKDYYQRKIQMMRDARV